MEKCLKLIDGLQNNLWTKGNLFNFCMSNQNSGGTAQGKAIQDDVASMSN